MNYFNVNALCAQGNEPLPHIAVPSDHASGFTNSLKPKPEFISKNPADVSRFTIRYHSCASVLILSCLLKSYSSIHCE